MNDDQIQQLNFNLVITLTNSSLIRSFKINYSIMFLSVCPDGMHRSNTLPLPPCFISLHELLLHGRWLPGGELCLLLLHASSLPCVLPPVPMAGGSPTSSPVMGWRRDPLSHPPRGELRRRPWRGKVRT